MSATSDRERETRAFDALIVYALRREPSEAELPDAPGDLGSLLSEEDRRALGDLGPDLVTRVLCGDWREQPVDGAAPPQKHLGRGPEVSSR